MKARQEYLIREEDAIAAIKGGKIVEGDVVVIRYEGPKGGPGMREMLKSYISHCRYGTWLSRLLLLQMADFQVLQEEHSIGHVSPEAAVGGPIALS